MEEEIKFPNVSKASITRFLTSNNITFKNSKEQGQIVEQIASELKRIQEELKSKGINKDEPIEAKSEEIDKLFEQLEGGEELKSKLMNRFLTPMNMKVVKLDPKAKKEEPVQTKKEEKKEEQPVKPKAKKEEIVKNDSEDKKTSDKKKTAQKPNKSKWISNDVVSKYLEKNGVTLNMTDEEKDKFIADVTGYLIRIKDARNNGKSEEKLCTELGILTQGKIHSDVLEKMMKDLLPERTEKGTPKTTPKSNEKKSEDIDKRVERIEKTLNGENVTREEINQLKEELEELKKEVESLKNPSSRIQKEETKTKEAKQPETKKEELALKTETKSVKAKTDKTGLDLIISELIDMCGGMVVEHSEVNLQKAGLEAEAEGIYKNDNAKKTYISGKVGERKGENYAKSKQETAEINAARGDRQRTISEGMADIIRKTGNISKTLMTGNTIADLAIGATVSSVGISAALTYGVVREGAKIIKGFRTCDPEKEYKAKKGTAKEYKEQQDKKREEAEKSKKEIKKQVKEYVDSYNSVNGKEKNDKTTNDTMTREEKAVRILGDISKEIANLCEERKSGMVVKVCSFAPYLTQEQKDLLTTIDEDHSNERWDAEDQLEEAKAENLKNIRKILKDDRTKETCQELMDEFGITEEQAKNFLEIASLDEETGEVQFYEETSVTLDKLEGNKTLLEQVKKTLAEPDEKSYSDKDIIKLAENYVETSDDKESDVYQKLTDELDSYCCNDAIYEYAMACDLYDCGLELNEQIQSVVQELEQLQSKENRTIRDNLRKSQLTKIAERKIESLKNSGVIEVVEDEKDKSIKVVNKGEAILTRDLDSKIHDTNRIDEGKINRVSKDEQDDEQNK